MRVLVTGAGLIGLLTARMLADRGDHVVVADVRDPETPPDERIAFARCDVAALAALDAVLAEHAIDRVIHTAAMLSTGIRRDPLRGVEVNVMGAANVLELARRRELRRVVVASSTTVEYAGFARHEAQPIEEDLPLRMIADRPASIYAMTKVANEQLALLYGDLYKLDVVVLRYGAVLGGGLGAPTSVPGRLLALLAGAPRDGRSVAIDDPFLLWGGVEEFVDARDCARANVCALDAAAPAQRVYHVATGRAVTMRDFAAAAEKAFPGLTVSPPSPPDSGFAGFPHQRPAPSSVEAASRELGFSCQRTLEDSLDYWGARMARADHGLN
ncbi:MAG: UDP-glucose 4-epimerase [Rhizobiales bacterium 65-9]|nr:NAD(P)-dependent oxidoreductase [Hyphomicrobiales bacterium]OJY38281.1 MAG: UDP-glucose 4-epimerase [Rhizobiales bacterium 65-9]